MADILAQASQVVDPLKGFVTTGISLIAWVFIIGIIAIISAIIIVILLLKKNYNFIVVKFDTNEKDEITDIGREKAMIIKFGNLGQRILYWKNSKIYTRYPERKVGLNKAYFKRNKYTNEWEDFVIKEKYNDEEIKIDTLRGKMISYNVGIRKGLKDYFEKKNWLKENIVLIASVTFVLMIGVMTWLLFDKWLELSSSIGAIADNVNKMMETSNTMLGKMDNICLGGSGISK